MGVGNDERGPSLFYPKAIWDGYRYKPFIPVIYADSREIKIE